MRSALDKISTQILRFIPFILAFVTPIFFLTTTTDLYSINKFYMVGVLASLSLLAWCVRSLTRGKLTFTLSPSLLPLVILIVAAVISSIWLSPIRHTSLFGMTAFFVSLTIIFITVTSSQKNRIVVDSIVTGLISSATVLSLVTLLHKFEILSRFITSEVLSNKYFNLTGGILTALAFTLPVLVATIAYLIVNKNWIIKSILFASAIFMIVASLVNLTLLLPQSGQQVLFILPYRASWSIAVDIFKNWQTALLGTGPETYFTTFTRLRPAFLNADNVYWSLRFPESGSYLLTLLTTSGAIGALAFIFAFLKPISVAIKHKAANLENSPFIFLTVALISSFITFIFIPAGIVSFVLAFVIVIGLTVEFKLLGLKNTKDVNLSISAKSEPESIYHDITEEGKFSTASLVLPWILTVLSVFLMSVYWFYAVPAYSAAMSAKQAEDLIKTNPVGAYLKEVNAASLDRFNSGYPLALSQFFKAATLSLLSKKDATEEDKKNSTDYMQRSVDYGRLAATLDPYNVNVWENLSDIYTSFIGSADGAQNFAVSHLAQAITLDQTNPTPRLKLGILFFNLGDSAQAIKLINQALDLKQNWDLPYYNLSAIYKYQKDYPKALQYMKAGFVYTDKASTDYPKVQEEIKSLESMVQGQQPAATSSAVIK